MPGPYRYNEEGKLRVVANPVTFAGLLDTAFNQIRQNAATSPAVLIHMLEVIEQVMECTVQPDRKAELIRHARLVAGAAETGIPALDDRASVVSRYQRVLEAAEQDINAS